MRLLLAVLSLFCAGSVLAGTGDINADGSVSRVDALLALKFAAGLQKPTASQQFAADVAPSVPDGVVSVADAVRVLRIALGVEPLLPTMPIPLYTTLTVSKSASPVFTLPGGYRVSGTLTTTTGAVYTGAIAFQDTTSRVVFGPWTLSGTGAFAAVLPAGTYQPVSITYRDTTTSNGETESSDAAVAVGSPLTVAGTTTGLAYKRPNPTALPILTVQYSGPSAPYLTSSEITLRDAGSTASSFGLNHVFREVFFTPAAVSVPAGSYSAQTTSLYGLSNGTFEDLYVWYGQPLNVTSSISKTLTFPKLYELHGTITSPGANPPLDVYAKHTGTGTADTTAANVPCGSDGSYLLAVQSGGQVIWVGITSPYDETLIDYLIPYTMPSANAAKNIAVPALPTFRVLNGTARGPSGTGISGATVMLEMVTGALPTAGQYRYTAVATTGLDGTFTIRVPDGAYDVTITP